jgi:hypothetical protein
MSERNRTDSTEALMRRTRSFLEDAIKLGGDVFQAALGNSAMLPQLLPKPRDPCACGCCNIPETECPPHRVCSMHLAAFPGQTVIARIRVINEAPVTRTFDLSASDFICGTHTAKFTTPPSLTIAAGASALAICTLVVPTGFVKGEYQSEILVAGSYEQFVEVYLEIGCDEILSGTCVVEQKERRYRIRAHHWYDHFQCVEPCGPVLERGDPVLGHVNDQ